MNYAKCLKFASEFNEGCTEKLEVEVNGEVPKEGKIAINSGNISSIELNYKDGKTIVKNFKGELIKGM